jgi:trimeric autotransporter adhesin
MKTNYAIRLFSLLSFLSVATLMAQTPEQTQKLISRYNLQTLQQLQTDFQQHFEDQKQKTLAGIASRGLSKTITLDDGGLAELQYFETDGTPIYFRTFNVAAARSTRANHLNSGGTLGLNLNGQNMIARVWDAGIARITHQEYDGPGGNDRFSIGDGTNQLNFHAAHVTGTIMASGFVANAKGMAPQARAVGYDWNNDLSEATQAASQGMLISNHSYGFNPNGLPAYFFGGYVSTSRNWDNVMYNAPYYLMVVAAGNDGTNNYNSSPLNPSLPQYDKLTGHATSKNNMVVASCQDANVDSQGDLISVNISSFSSQGPTDDLRIKPDITGNGQGVYSTYDNADNAYASISGTSMASPNVSGTLLLLQQHAQEVNGNFMRAATLKGLALHTADDAGAVGPDAIFGWGLLNAKKAAQTLSQNGVNSIVNELTLMSGQSYTIQVESDGVSPLLASICWTDPAGTASTELNSDTPKLVNDLDIRMSQAGTTFTPWRLTGVNTNGKGDNNRDPFERVDINGASGTYTITVTHKSSLSGNSQHYSLIVTGITSEPVTCQATVPSGLMVNGVEATTAMLGWNTVVAAQYDIRYRVTGTTTWTVQSAMGSSITLQGLTPLSSYEVQVRSKCANNTTSAYSSAVTFQTTEVGLNYCNAQGQDVSDEYIGRVQLNTLDNVSGSGSGYSNFTQLNTTLTKGQNYTITITPVWTGSVYPEGYAVWIDYNKNGSFDDPGELVFSRTPTTQTPVSGSFTVPVGATDGATRMRVSMKYNGVPTSCEVIAYGEVEDYTVIIEGGEVDSQAPSQPTQLSTDQITDVSLRLQWNASTDNVGVTGYDVEMNGQLWGGVTATLANITNLIPETPYTFRVRAKDVAGNLSAWSAPVTATTTETVITYCQSRGTNTSREFIESVKIGNYTHTSGNNNGYGDFTNVMIPVSLGASVSITITPGWNGSSRSEGYGVWIDWNGNGQFTDVGEFVFSQARTNATSVTGTIQVPAQTSSNTVRMRVGMKFNGIPGSCEVFNNGEVEDYTLTLSAPVPDTQAPSTPLQLAASQITHNSITLNWSASTDNVGVTGYDVFVNNNLFTTVATNTATLTGLNPSTSFFIKVRAKDAAGNLSGFSNELRTSTPEFTISYCHSQGNSTAREFINTLQVGTYTNTSGDNGGYGDFTSETIFVTKGSSQTITITPGWNGSPRNVAYRVWIDWNGDGDFDDAGELVYNRNKTNASQVSGSFTVPLGALTGTTRMRVAAKFNANPGPCEVFNSGEVEDYTIAVINGNVVAVEDPEREETVDTSSLVLNIAPNPVQNTLQLSLSSDQAQKTIIHNASGRKVFDGMYQEKVDVSTWAAGVYWIQVETNGTLLSKKFIKI